MLNIVNKLSYILIAAIIGLGAIVGIQRMTSPAHFVEPTVEHYHFRLQLLVDGELINFGNPEYQEPYIEGQCSADLPETPIHFHDSINQLTHIHWDGIRGGDVLKYYGWNLIGGRDDRLGKRYDQNIWGNTVPIHGKILPEVPDNFSFYLYSGSEDNFEKRELDDFLQQDLEVFFNKESLLQDDGSILSSLKNLFVEEAYAHAEHISEENQALEDERLTRINNLVGDIVIFVQENEPTNAEINERFTLLTPLQDSTCGG